MPRNDSSFTTTTLNALAIVASTASTNSTTGAIVCPGGVGIGGNLNVAGTITGGAISYASTSTGTLTVTDGTGTTFNVDSTTECTGIGTGSAIFDGGVYIAKNLHVGGTVTAGAITYASTSTGTLAVTTSPGNTVVVSSTEDSASKTTGSITTPGGIGAGKKISAGSLTTYDTTQSTSISTGAIITPGGIGAAGNIYVGGTLVAGNATVAGNIVNQGFDLILGNGDQATRGNSGSSRAIVKDVGNVLVINFNNDYTGGTKIAGPLQVVGAGTFTTGAFTSVSCSTTSTFAGITATGTTSVVNLTVSGTTSVVNQTVSGTLGVTGNTTLTTLTASGVITMVGITGSGDISTTGIVINGGYDFKLGNKDTVRGDSGQSRALTKDTGNILVINYAGDYAGGVRIDSSLSVPTDISTDTLAVSNTANLAATSCTSLTCIGTLLASGGIDSAAPILTTSLTASGNVTAGSINSSGTVSLTGTTTLNNLSVTGSASFSNAVASAAGTSTFANATIAGALEGGTVRVGGSLALAKSTGVVEVGNDTDATLIRGVVSLNGYDLKIGTGNQVDRGNSGASRALVKEAGTLPASKLVINYAGDFTGGVEVQSNLAVTGNVVATGSVSGSNLQIAGVVVAELLSSQYNLGVDGSDNILRGNVNVKGNDFRLSKGDTSRGNSGESRALVHGFSNQLIVNFGGDFTGGVEIQSPVTASNFRNGTFTPTFSLRFQANPPFNSSGGEFSETPTVSMTGKWALAGTKMVIDIICNWSIIALGGVGGYLTLGIPSDFTSGAVSIPAGTVTNVYQCHCQISDVLPVNVYKTWWTNAVYRRGPSTNDMIFYERDALSMYQTEPFQDQYQFYANYLDVEKKMKITCTFDIADVV